ncbi:TPA: hypothetical protein JI046_12930 [Acinetobacter baumannii]|nr:hypothetical protein [Acinetobacter baumannii]
MKMTSILDMKKIIENFGGVERIHEAQMKQDRWDVYCWETKQWYTSRYWAKFMQDKYTGITMHELVCTQHDYEKLVHRLEIFNNDTQH